MSARDELANLLDRHMSDRDYDQGCRLACGYSGDDRDEHLADAILAAGFVRAGAAEALLEEIRTLVAADALVPSSNTHYELRALLERNPA